jgi:DNA modification methylase
MRGMKTGGRVKGSVDLRPRRNARATSVPTSVPTPVAATVATAAGGAAPSEPNNFAPQAGARARAGRNAAREASLPPSRRERVDRLIPFEGNARTHSKASIDKLCKLITAFGWTSPILVAGRKILAGHARRLAAMKLGIEIVPVIDLKHLTRAQQEAVILSDNRAALDGGWDQGLLTDAFERLKEFGFDLELTAFDPSEFKFYLGDESSGGLTDPDDVPPLAAPVSVLGDVWTLGRHRICCGDSTNPDHVAALMQGAAADLCFTSPPYAEQRDYQGGAMPWDDLMRGVFGILPVTHEAQVLVNLGMVHRDGEWMPYWDGWIGWMRAEGWRRFGWYVWDQGFGLPGHWQGRLAPSHEWIFHFNRVAEQPHKTKDKRPENIGNVRATSVLRAKDGTKGAAVKAASTMDPTKIPDSVIRVSRNANAKDIDHPAVFPVDLATEIITAFSDPGDTVYEPFTGSGTQLIAAEKNDRTCLGMEIAPAYVDVAIRRFQAFSGTEAIHADGRTFAAIEAARGVVAKPARTKVRVKVAA